MNRKTATETAETAPPENDGIATATADAEVPAKRGPGRPKGSTKAATEAARALRGLDQDKKQRKTRALSTDTVTETAKIIEAALKSRGAHGALQDDLQAIMDWARGVRAEGEALKDFNGRPRRQKAESYPERIARFEMNRALLDGVLAGNIGLDVQNGALRFLQANQTATPAPASSPLPPE